MEVIVTADIDLWVIATILRELRSAGLITQKEAEKILSRVNPKFCVNAEL